MSEAHIGKAWQRIHATHDTVTCRQHSEICLAPLCLAGWVGVRHHDGVEIGGEPGFKRRFDRCFGR